MIAFAGFQHETNSFGAGQAGLNEYRMDDSWPGLLEGPDVATGTKGLNLPIAGALKAAADAGVDIAPILWGSAEPSGPVTDEAFDVISQAILDGVASAGTIDGLYLDLHGAMITESFDDGEGELLRRIRARFGEGLPIAVSLDMHANITADLVKRATSISIYRTYPHLDMAETGQRAFRQLQRHISGAIPAKAFRQIPYIIPMHAQYTGDGAMGRLYDDVVQASTEDVQVELAVGFTGGDMADNGPSIIAHAPDQATADAAADTLLKRALDAEDQFECHLPSAQDAVETAMRFPPGKPVTIADVQDNPGGGTSSDTTGLLRALVRAKAANAILGMIHDPAAAALAHKAGVGATFETEIGGRSGIEGDAPFAGTFRVDALGDGHVTYEGEMYGGGVAEIGPTANLTLMEPETDIRIVVASVRNQCLDRGFFRHLGLTPETARIIVVKSTVHYRADFEPISQAVISAGAPGMLICDIQAIPYQKLRAGVRLGPLGPGFTPPHGLRSQ